MIISSIYCIIVRREGPVFACFLVEARDAPISMHIPYCTFILRLDDSCLPIFVNSLRFGNEGHPISSTLAALTERECRPQSDLCFIEL